MKTMKRTKKRYSIRLKMMGINISITLVSFLLYGGLFLLSVSLLISRYINSDMDFFLTEISDNLDEKYEYMEDMIYETRDSDLLMGFLQNGYENLSLEQVQNDFEQAVDISNSDNQRTEGEPVVEKVYLFRDNGEFISDFYYTMVSSEIEESHRIVKQAWEGYSELQKSRIGFDTYYYNYQDILYIACPIMDDKMDAKGSMIFVINQESIRNVMEEVENYQGAFWMIYEQDGEMLDGIDQGISLSDIEYIDMERSSSYISSIGIQKYRVYHTELGLGVSVVIGIPENHAVRILFDSIGIYVIMLFAILLVGLLSFAVFTYKITKPMGEVAGKLRKVQEGDYEIKLPDYDSKEFYEISNSFNLMTTEINHLIKEVYEKQILLKELELKFLQSQLNPHFIFNVLNALALQSKMDGNEHLSKTISTFSQLIQAKIYRSDKEKVRIFQELEYAKYYLEIQKFRYGDRLTYSIDVDEKLMNYYIQKLSIQMIVENAVVHGLEPKMSGGTVYIRGIEEHGHIRIDIIDDGVGFESNGEVELPLKNTRADQSHNQVGLNNIHAILQLRYGKGYGLSVYSRKNEGTTVTICIPFDSGTEQEEMEWN